MRRTIASLMFMFVLLGVSGLGAQTAAPSDGKTLSFVGDEWAPFNMSPGGKPEGYIVDIIRAVFEPLGYKVEYHLVPWGQAIEESKAGTYTAIIGASKADGEGYVFPDEEVAITRLTFVTSVSSTWKFTDRASVEKTSLAIIDGYDYRPWLSDYIEKHRGDESRIQVMKGDHPLESNLKRAYPARPARPWTTRPPCATPQRPLASLAGSALSAPTPTYPICTSPSPRPSPSRPSSPRRCRTAYERCGPPASSARS